VRCGSQPAAAGLRATARRALAEAKECGEGLETCCPQKTEQLSPCAPPSYRAISFLLSRGCGHTLRAAALPSGGPGPSAPTEAASLGAHHRVSEAGVGGCGWVQVCAAHDLSWWCLWRSVTCDVAPARTVWRHMSGGHLNICGLTDTHVEGVHQPLLPTVLYSGRMAA
jgi:hypothetical protein